SRTNLKPGEFWPLVTINGGEVTPDYDTDRRLDRPFRTNPGAGSGEPPPASNSVKPLAFEIRDVERRLAEARAALREEEARTAIQAADTELVLKLFAAGGATAEEAAKAKAQLEEAQARLKTR